MGSADPVQLKPFSVSLTSKAKSTAPTSRPLNPKKRPHSSLADYDSDHEDAPQHPQLVSAFDQSAGGAISVNGGGEERKKPLVIRCQKNRAWLEESFKKRGKNLLPAEVQAARRGHVAPEGGVKDEDEAPQTFGLNFVETNRKNAEDTVTQQEAPTGDSAPATEPQKPRDPDQEALEALTSGRNQQSTLIIPAATTNGDRGSWTEPVDEDHAFRLDVASRPDPASLADYAAVPVEEFGAAMLRGMGWKEGGVIGKRKDQVSEPRDVTRRPALLGLGAKEVPGSVEEFGAWGKAAKDKRKVDKTYNPVMLKNSVTGQMLTEEEFEAKKAEQKEEEEDWRQRRDKNLALDMEKKRRGKYDDREDGHSRRGHSRSRESRRRDSKRRDRSRSADRSLRTSSRRDRSRSPESNRHSSSRRDRSRSSERKYKKRRDRDYNDYDKKDKDYERKSKHSNYDDYDDYYYQQDKDRRHKQAYEEKEHYRSSKHSHRKRGA
ncbi:MAG: hypothetical protein Q9191_000542 [Dirinaria sp. TL-2023a]